MANVWNHPGIFRVGPMERVLERDRPERCICSPGRTLRYRLMTALQTTLDVEHLLALLYDTIAVPFEIEGLAFAHPTEQLDLSVGRRATYQRRYQLADLTDEAGELVISRATPFDTNIISKIEGCIVLFRYPLRNALRFRRALTASLLDPLTKLGNRKALETVLEREMAAAGRYEKPLAVLLLDIDKFKRINDEHGHIAGDTVLRAVAETLTITHRATDACFRYGGEEFVIVLPNTSLEGAQIIADRLRECFNSKRIDTSDHSLCATVSIGFSTWREGDSVSSLLERSDCAMYAAKRAGGNCISSM